MRGRRNNNGIPILFGSAVILFAAVFIMSRFTGNIPEKDMESGAASETTASVSDTVPSSSNASDVSSGIPEEPASEGSENTESVSSDETTVSEESAGEPKPDPDDADNTWAMFLVNTDNPVSQEYCDGIETAFVYESWREYYMDSRMAEYMKQMLKAAAEDGCELKIVSAYRTIKYQQDNFDRSVKDRMDNRGMTYEEAYADTLREVQLPGYSEHNAGIAADIMSDEYESMDDDGFENTKAFEWLSENAADYGFILRYPKGREDITGIIYEPWHYRFVGVYYAKLLDDRDITMEEYFKEMNWVDNSGKAISHIPQL